MGGGGNSFTLTFQKKKKVPFNKLQYNEFVINCLQEKIPLFFPSMQWVWSQQVDLILYKRKKKSYIHTKRQTRTTSVPKINKPTLLNKFINTGPFSLEMEKRHMHPHQIALTKAVSSKCLFHSVRWQIYHSTEEENKSTLAAFPLQDWTNRHS